MSTAFRNVSIAHGKVHEYLGGRLHIVGAIRRIDTVAVALRDASQPHKHLPESCFEPNTCGDVVLVRTHGEHANPVDLSVADVKTAIQSGC